MQRRVSPSDSERASHSPARLYEGMKARYRNFPRKNIRATIDLILTCFRRSQGLNDLDSDSFPLPRTQSPTTLRPERIFGASVRCSILRRKVTTNDSSLGGRMGAIAVKAVKVSCPPNGMWMTTVDYTRQA